jgi:hypothetical protein
MFPVVNEGDGVGDVDLESVGILVGRVVLAIEYTGNQTTLFSHFCVTSTPI